jgi:hydrogenase expression/formation protein HypC
MCLSVIGRITHIDGEHAVVDIDGKRRKASLAMLLLEDHAVSTGDWVLLHTGFAVAVLDPDEVAELTWPNPDLAITKGDRDQ